MSGSADFGVTWDPNQMVEIVLSEPDDFLKVRETLTRIGVASRKEKKLYQSCHILHNRVSIILFTLRSCLLLTANTLTSL